MWEEVASEEMIYGGMVVSACGGKSSRVEFRSLFNAPSMLYVSLVHLESLREPRDLGGLWGNGVLFRFYPWQQQCQKLEMKLRIVWLDMLVWKMDVDTESNRSICNIWNSE